MISLINIMFVMIFVAVTVLMTGLLYMVENGNLNFNKIFRDKYNIKEITVL